MRIGFASGASARVFSEFELMKRAFGVELAYKLANRLALLSAVQHLALVPTTPPIGCRPLDSGDGRFAVSVSAQTALVFRALGPSARAGSLAKITAIEIEGVEKQDARSARAKR